MAVVRYCFSLDPKRDAALIRWLDRQSGTTYAVRRALQAYVERPSHAELEAKLDQVLDVLRGVQVIGAGATATEGAGEPARAVKGLETMLGRFREGAA